MTSHKVEREDPLLSSKENDGISKTRKRISMKKQPEFRPNSKKPRIIAKKKLSEPVEDVTDEDEPFDSFFDREASFGPSVQLAFDYDGLCSKEEVLEFAGIALSSWNEKSLSKQGPEYVLVESLGGVSLVGPCIYHCNFIARPKNTTEAEDKLFFAEVEWKRSYMKDGKEGALGCNDCYILGPSGTVTGLFGCRFCEKHPKLVQHPTNGDFIKGRNDALVKAKANAKGGWVA